MMTDLASFCAAPKDQPGRPYLHQPFSQGAWTYATDGHICVRVPTRLPDIEDQNIPDAAKLFKDIDRTNLRPLRHIAWPQPETNDCDSCNGTGKEHSECPDCTCDCEICDGTGTVTQKATIGIDNKYFAYHLLKKIKDFTNLKITIHEIKHSTNTYHALFFTSDEGEGLLMNYSTKENCHADEDDEGTIDD